MSHDMAIRDLIEALEEIAEQHDDNVIVRLATQPSWPFEHSISEAVAVEVEENGHDVNVCYLGEGRQVGYLPGAAAVALGWSEENDEEEDDEEACPGCGCVPGGGVTAGCTHPAGCGAVHS